MEKKNNSSITLVITKKGNWKCNDYDNKNILYSKEKKSRFKYVELGFMICSKNDILENLK